MTALILWVPARILLLCTRGFVQQYSSSTSNVNVFSCVHNVLMNKLAGKMCFQMQYLRGGSLKFTAFQCCHPQSPRADVTFLIVKLPCTPGGGPLGPRSYFQQIWTSFWTHGTIFDQFIVKGVHQWSCRKKILRVPWNLPELSQFSSARKISQNLDEKFKTKICELKMAIAQSIFKILRSSFFANTSIFIAE